MGDGHALHSTIHTWKFPELLIILHLFLCILMNFPLHCLSIGSKWGRISRRLKTNNKCFCLRYKKYFDVKWGRYYICHTVISLKYYGIFRCQHKSFYLHGDFPPEASTDDALCCRKTMTLVCWSVIVDTICQLHNSIPLRDFKSVSGRQISAIYFLSFKIRRSNAFCRINNYCSAQKMSKLSLQVCGG